MTNEKTAAVTAHMLTGSGWVPVTLPGGCRGWNGAHDCGRENDHPGDHVCAGCHDQWNRGEWDDDADEWEHERPPVEHRC
jgi:hypothetical protein